MSGYGDAVPAGKVVREDDKEAVFKPARKSEIHEVGVTDLAMMTLWKHGPDKMCHSVSSTAESNHLGADIAIVDTRPARKRILLYQAKVVKNVDRTRNTLTMKGAIEPNHRKIFKKSTVEIDGEEYPFRALLALYQTDLTQYRLHQGRDPFFSIDGWEFGCWDHTCRPMFGPLPPELDRRLPKDMSPAACYYHHFLYGRGCSPGGILAACIPDSGTVINAAETFPWEFETYAWLTDRKSPLEKCVTRPHEVAQDGQMSGADSDDRPEFEASGFEPYGSDGTQSERLPDDRFQQIAQGLVTALELSDDQQLFISAL